MQNAENLFGEMSRKKWEPSVEDWVIESLKTASTFCEGVEEFLDLDLVKGKGRKKKEVNGNGDGEDEGGSGDEVFRLEGTLNEEEMTELWNEAAEWRNDAVEALTDDEEEEVEESKDVEMKDATVKVEGTLPLSQPKVPLNTMLRFMNMGGFPQPT